MNQELNKETIKSLTELTGEVRGAVFATDAEYIIHEKGKEGLKVLERELARLGYPLQYQKIKTMNFYPVWWRAISLLAVKELFGFSDEKIKDMGAAAPKVSFVIKLFMNYFNAVEKTMDQMPKMWRKHYTIGDLSLLQYDEKRKKIILKLENFNIHPVICIYLAGYFQKIIEMVVKSSAVCQETKCYFEGNSYHEFSLQW